MALELYSNKEIPTSTKFNKMVNAVNDMSGLREYKITIYGTSATTQTPTSIGTLFIGDIITCNASQNELTRVFIYDLMSPSNTKELTFDSVKRLWTLTVPSKINAANIIAIGASETTVENILQTKVITNGTSYIPYLREDVQKNANAIAQIPQNLSSRLTALETSVGTISTSLDTINGEEI